MTIELGPLGSSATLEVEPTRLSATSAAFRAAAQRVRQIVEQSRWSLVIEPPMADPISVEFATFVTQHHVTSSSSIVHVLEKYCDVLLGIADALEASRLAYERAEVDTAERFT